MSQIKPKEKEHREDTGGTLLIKSFRLEILETCIELLCFWTGWCSAEIRNPPVTFFTASFNFYIVLKVQAEMICNWTFGECGGLKLCPKLLAYLRLKSKENILFHLTFYSDQLILCFKDHNRMPVFILMETLTSSGSRH